MATGIIISFTEKEIKFNHRKILPGYVTYCNTGSTRINEKFSQCIHLVQYSVGLLVAMKAIMPLKLLFIMYLYCSKL